MKRFVLFALALLACGDRVVEHESTVLVIYRADAGDAGATPEDAGEER